MACIGPHSTGKKIYYIILKFNNKKCVTVIVINMALKLDCPLMIIYLFIFYIPWIFWGKPHLDIGIVKIDRNALHNMYIQLS
jgi:hypothetical protein